MRSILRRCCLTVLVLAVVALVSCRAAEQPRAAAAKPASPPPVILISIDTLRADRLPAWGYDKVETPAIDALRADGIQYRNAWSPVPLTLPSHVSILTGLLPYEHGVRDNLGYRYDPEQHVPVTTPLRRAGYKAGASVSAYVMRGSTGLGGAFDDYDDAITARAGTNDGELQRPGSAAVSSATAWIGQHRDDKFFYLLHLFEPHTPYSPPEPFESRYDDPYDGEVAAADELVGEMISFLKSAEIYDKALVILLSDHGEGLGDHGESEHGVLLYREALHVPLIVKLPDSHRAGDTVESNVQLIDVAPTIAAVTGVELQSNHGRSLLLPRTGTESVYSESYYPKLHFGWSELRSIVDDRFHYIEAPTPELYDLASDPRELTNLASDRRRDLARLREAMTIYPKGGEAPLDVDPEEAKKLAALGYVGSGERSFDPTANPRERIGEIEALRKGLSLEARASPEDLVGFYREVLDRNPESIDLRGKLAAALELAGHPDDAEREYKRVLAMRPIVYQAVAISLAELQLRMGKLDEAKTHALLALESDPHHSRQILARVATARGDFAGAEKLIGDPNEDPTLRAFVVLAQVRANEGRLDDAIALLETAQAKADRRGIDVELMNYALGDLYLATRQLPRAEVAFRDEIQTSPRNLQAWAKLALTLAAQRKPAEIDSVLSEMVRLNPGQRSRSLAEQTRKQIASIQK